MALAAKRRVVVNAGRRTKSNRPRRKNLTAKQIKFFGTPAQKAALKRKRSATRANTRHRVRATINRSRSYNPPKRHRGRSKNPGEILSLVLNPGGRKGKKNMAAPRRRRKSSGASGRRSRRRRSVANPHHRRRRRMSNPAPRRHRRRNYTRHSRRRRNPSSSGGSFKNAITQGLAFMGGFFGSKLATQLVMSSSNTGTAGYLGNAAATAALAIIASIFPPTKKLSLAIVAGGATQILARILSDNTAFGQVTSALGVGDYQMQNFVTPQRLVAPLDSAQIEIPAGWGASAPVVVSTASAPGAHPGVSGYNTQGVGRGMYSSAGLYS